MAQKLYTESYIQNIANSIRAINQKTDKYKVSEMSIALNEIIGGMRTTKINLIFSEYTIIE